MSQAVASSLDSPRPIHVALKRKRQDPFNLLRVVRNLLESGHNPAEVDGNGQTALHVCSTVGAPLAVLRLFVDRVDPVVLDKPDFSSLTPLHCLLIQDGVVDPACLECLVAAGASLTSPSETRGTPLDCLARRSNDVVKLFDCLLDVSLDVLRQNEWSLLRIAFADGSVVFMKTLLSHWHRLSNESWMTLLSPPVFDAVSSSRDAEAKALLAIDHGANPSKEVWPRNETLAHRASAFGSVLLLEAAKEHGVDFSAKDDDGRTPLHLAVNGNCPPKQAAVDFLIEQCVNLDEVDDGGATALEKAIGGATRNLDAAVSLICAGSKLPCETEIPYDVVVALSSPDVITRSVSPILTALEVGAFVRKTSKCVASEEERSAFEQLSDDLVNVASELATVDNSAGVMERAISVAVRNDQRKFLLNSRVQPCLNRLFFASPVRRRGQSQTLLTTGRFVTSLLLLFVRYVTFPFVLFLDILPRRKASYAIAANDYLMSESLVVSYAAHGISAHLYMCVLIFLASGSSLPPRHLVNSTLSSFEWLIMLQLVGEIAYETGQLRRQGRRSYITQISNWWDILIITLMSIGLCVRFHLMSHVSATSQNLLSILYAFLFLAVVCRLLLYMIILPYFGPMVISFRQMIYPLLCYVFFFAVFLLGFGVCLKNIYGIQVFRALCRDISSTNSSTNSCLSFADALNQLPADQKSLGKILHVLFLSMVNLASSTELGVEILDSYSVQEVLGLIVKVVWVIWSTIILLNMLIALVSNAYQTVHDNAAAEWIFLKAEIVTEMRRSPLVPPPLNVLYILARSIAYLVTLCCGWKEEKNFHKAFANRRASRRLDISRSRALLANFKTAAEEKELDQPVTKRQMHLLLTEIKRMRETLDTANEKHIGAVDDRRSEAGKVAEWVSERLRRRLCSVRQKMLIRKRLLPDDESDGQLFEAERVEMTDRTQRVSIV